MKTFPMSDRMIQDMQLHGQRPRTQESYLRAVRKLCEWAKVPPQEITEEQLREYLLLCKNTRGWSRNTMQVAYYGIKFFFENTLKRDWPTLGLIRAETEHKLPVVLSKDEVRLILKSIRTMHNRAFFTTKYCCGLRLEECQNVQLPDIDSKRMLLHVRGGKGAKDRYVPLPRDLVIVLREYWKTHKNPVWIFPALGRGGKKGATAKQPMSQTSVQGALRRVMKELPGIKKRVHPHVFRHSYATHLIEAGVNIRLVQQYLGHASLSSTMIYLHVTQAGQEDACQRINDLMKAV